VAQERGLPRPRVETAGLTLVSAALASNRQPLSKLAALEGRAPARWHDFRKAGRARCLSFLTGRPENIGQEPVIFQPPELDPPLDWRLMAAPGPIARRAIRGRAPFAGRDPARV